MNHAAQIKNSNYGIGLAKFNKPKRIQKTKRYMVIEGTTPVTTSQAVLEKDVAVDIWINKLTDTQESYESSTETNQIYESSTEIDQSNQEITLIWVLQQNLLRIKLSTFGGLPLLWVQIIIEFQDIGHSKNFLNNQQKLHYLHQNVIGEARRAVQVYSND